MAEGAVASLREAHVETTRQRILDAVTELLVEANPATVSVGDVARRAGVSERTVYRHFPTKDDLFRVAATQTTRMTEAWVAEQREAEVDPGELVRRLWTELAGDLPGVRAQLATPQGRALRAVRTAPRREWLTAVVAREGIDPGTPEGARLVHLLMALVASPTLLELHDTVGVPVEQAADDVAWAIRALIEATRDTNKGAQP